MLKKNKKFFIASCIVILLPMFAGFLLWDQLPAQVATHFGKNGEVDRYSSKLFAVAGIYLFVLAAPEGNIVLFIPPSIWRSTLIRNSE